FDVQDGIVPDLSSWGVRHDNALAFSPDGKLIASSNGQQVIRLWDVSNKTANRPLNTFVGHKGKVASIAFAPDGRLLASASDDGAIHVWDLSHGEIRWNDSVTPASVLSVTFSPDGKRLVSTSSDGAVKFWDAARGKLMGPKIEPRAEPQGKLE